MNITGQILNPNTKTPVSNATVDLYAAKIGSGIWSGSYSFLQSSVTNESGNYNFNFDAIRASGFRLNISKSGFFSSEEHIETGKIKKGEFYFLFSYLYTEAFLKIHVVNNSPYSDADKISVRITKGNLNSYECCWDSSYTYLGKYVDITKTCKTHGSQYVSFEWEVQNSFVHNIYRDSVFCVANDTTTFTIGY